MGRVRGRGALGRLVLMCCLALPSSVVTAPRARCARPCSPRRTLRAGESPPPPPPPPSRHQPVWLSALNLRGGGATSAVSTRERGNKRRAAHARNDSGRDDKSRRSAPGNVRKVQSRGKGAGAGERSTALKVKERRLSTMSAETALKGSLADRLQWLVGKEAGTVQGLGGQKVSAAQAAMVSHVRSLQTVLQTQDQTAISAVLDQVAATARKTYAPGIWSVGQLKTGGFALGGSGRQRELQRSTTAYVKTEVLFDGSGASVAEIREKARVLCLPNPTDEVLGIDEHTELRLALAAANETRQIPWNVTQAQVLKSNRELGRYAKAAIGDMHVSEDVAVKYWLQKRREKRAQMVALETAKREERILQYATYLYMDFFLDAQSKGQLFDQSKAEQRSLQRARYVLEVEPYKEQQMVVREADERKLDLADPTLVKPKLRRPFKLKGRKGPRRKLKTKSKVVKRAGSGGKTNKSRSGLSGGKSGASRFKKRKA